MQPEVPAAAYFPAAHEVQPETPVDEAYLPDGHAEQEEEEAVE